MIPRMLAVTVDGSFLKSVVVETQSVSPPKIKCKCCAVDTWCFHLKGSEAVILSYNVEPQASQETPKCNINIKYCNIITTASIFCTASNPAAVKQNRAEVGTV